MMLDKCPCQRILKVYPRTRVMCLWAGEGTAFAYPHPDLYSKEAFRIGS